MGHDGRRRSNAQPRRAAGRGPRHEPGQSDRHDDDRARRSRAVAEVARRLGLWLVSDEIYHGLTYDEPAETALAFEADAIVVNSFSKYYCMTGWRIGWLVVPPRGSCARSSGSPRISTSPRPSSARLRRKRPSMPGEELEAVKAGYAANRGLLLDELPRLGLETAPVDGAFYVYADAARIHGRYPGLLSANARRRRRGGDAGPRFRHEARPAVPAHLLRRLAARVP